MYLNIRGGIYDVFSARVYSNWMPHNLLFNGLTPFTGAGAVQPVGDLPAARTRRPGNRSTWGIERKDTGGTFEWQVAVAVVLPRRRQPASRPVGTKVGSGSNGTSPGNGFTDLAAAGPVPDQQRHWRIRLRHLDDDAVRELSCAAASDNVEQHGRPGTTGSLRNGVDTTYLPPEQQLPAPRAQRRRGGSCRGIRSLALRYTWDQTESDLDDRPDAS